MMPKEEVALNQVNRLINFGPLILVSTASGSQRTIAPIAWYAPLSQKPPFIGLAVGQSHLTHLLITKSEEFAVNIPSIDLVRAVIYCGSTSGEKEDKFKGAGFTAVTGREIKAPLIAECFANIECRVTEKIAVGDHTLFIGKVVAAQIVKDFFTDGNIVDISKIKTIHHLGGQHFAALDGELNLA